MSGKKPASPASPDDSDLVKHVTTLLELERRTTTGTLSPTTERVVKTKFWSEMRDVLAHNEQSRGVEILDDIASGLIDREGDAADAFSGPVLLLPAPSRQRAGGKAPDHSTFSNTLKRSSPPSGSPSCRSSKSPKRARMVPASDSSPKVFVDFELSPRAPTTIRDDVERLYRQATSLKATVYERAYPWMNEHLGTIQSNFLLTT